MNNVQKIYITLGVMTIIIILMIGFLVKPLISEIKQTSISVSGESQKLLIAQKIDINYLRKIEDDYKRIKDGIAVFKVSLNDDQIVEYIQEMESIANNTSNGLEIKSANSPIFHLSLNGDFSNLMKFLGWLENNQYLVSIDSMQTKKLSEKNVILNESKTIFVGDINTILQIRLPI
jgi:hypothetical protein